MRIYLHSVDFCFHEVGGSLINDSFNCQRILSNFSLLFSMLWMQAKQICCLVDLRENFIHSKRLNVNKAGKIRALWWWCLTCCKRKCKDRGRKLSALHCSASVNRVERGKVYVCMYIISRAEKIISPKLLLIPYQIFSFVYLCLHC